jgi:hypothetical protein
LAADLTFCENLLKYAGGTISAFGVVEEPQFRGHAMATEPAGLISTTLRASFRTLQNHLKDRTIPELKEQIGVNSKFSQSFNTAVHALIAEMRRSLTTFLEKTTKARAQLQDSDVSAIAASFDVGMSLHYMYSDLHSKFERIEQKMNTELNKTESILASALKTEDQIIKDVVVRISSGFPFFEASTTPQREIRKEGTIPFWQTKIASAFFTLRSGEVRPVSYPKLEVPKDWMTNVVDGFYARVWADFTAEKECEIDVQRKEIVKVINGGEFSHWNIERTDGERGFVPCALLQPVS